MPVAQEDCLTEGKVCLGQERHTLILLEKGHAVGANEVRGHFSCALCPYVRYCMCLRVRLQLSP